MNGFGLCLRVRHCIGAAALCSFLVLTAGCGHNIMKRPNTSREEGDTIADLREGGPQAAEATIRVPAASFGGVLRDSDTSDQPLDVLVGNGSMDTIVGGDGSDDSPTNF